MRRVLILGLLCPLLAGALVYVGDYVSLRYRIPSNRAQFGSVVVQVTWVIPMKDGKTQYAFDPPAPQECVNSLFPHLGDPPCWYLSRHTKQQVNTGSR
ncbi:MAG TPA: hypothetical protein VN924_33465 [Bryobacteraceae bacterium]|nr:hypothetical protein [Bryobacteraceae bacterium]